MKDVLLDVLVFVLVDALVFVLVDQLGIVLIDVLDAACCGTTCPETL